MSGGTERLGEGGMLRAGTGVPPRRIGATESRVARLVTSDFWMPATEAESPLPPHVDIQGTPGPDSLVGGAGPDTLEGRAGNDTLLGRGGGDLLDGGSGIDWADYGDAQLAVVAHLAKPAKNEGDAAGDSYLGIEHLHGSEENDRLIGNGKANMIEGDSGDDVLKGRGGNDTLVARNGEDRLIGGTGADFFQIERSRFDGPDLIGDFTAGEDTLLLRAAAFDLPAGDLDPSNLALGSHANDLDDYIIYDPATGALYFDFDGSGFIQQQLIATLAGAPTLSAADFVVV